MRTSKKQYFAQFFEENQTNIKKTWEGIRNLLNVSKKSATLINKIIENDVIFTDAKKISNKLNDFYVNMGNNIDKKFPIRKLTLWIILEMRITSKSCYMNAVS